MLFFERYQFSISLIILLTLFATVTSFANDEVYLSESDIICLDEDDYVQDDIKVNHFECEVDDGDGDGDDGSVANNCIAIDRDPFISFLDTPQIAISSSIKSFAITLDEFFTNEKTYYESSGSYLRLTFDTISKDGGRIDDTGEVNFKLRLPNTEKKLMFVLETEPDQFGDDIKQSVNTTPREDTSFAAEIQTVIKEKEHWRLKPVFGIKTGAGKLDPFFRLSMDWNNNIGQWDLHWNETPRWIDSNGWGVDSLFEFSNKLTEKTLFRSSAVALWESANDYFNLSEVISLFHTLDDKTAVLYQAGVYGTSEPVISTESFLLSIRYRQNVYKDYLFVEVIPQIQYLKANNFSPEHSLLFKIEMLFKG